MLTTLATCWWIKLKSGKVLSFTDFDQDIELDNIVYISTNKFMPSAITLKNNVNSIFYLEGVIDQDFDQALYDGAEVKIIIANYQTKKKKEIAAGNIANITLKDSKFIAEILPFKSKMNLVVGSEYSKTCRAEFCDKACGLNINNYKVKGRVVDKIDKYSFISDIKENFSNCIIEFTRTKNFSYNVKGVLNQKVFLFSPLSEEVAIGDEFVITLGCDKTFESCINYKNAINFRGEPHINLKLF